MLHSGLRHPGLLADMAEKENYGRYHATNEGLCSWYEFACEIFKQAAEIDPAYGKVSVSPVSSDQYPAKAKRPSNSRMSKEKLTETIEKLPTLTGMMMMTIVMTMMIAIMVYPHP